jgi:hypothetical protein
VPVLRHNKGTGCGRNNILSFQILKLPIYLQLMKIRYFRKPSIFFLFPSSLTYFLILLCFQTQSAVHIATNNLFEHKPGEIFPNTSHLCIPGLVANHISKHLGKSSILTAEHPSTFQYFCLTLREEYMLRIFDNRVLSRMHALETYNLHH